MKHFDVIVIGAGHAGVEAAMASARVGAKTALISFHWNTVGVMSCNPAIGGLGKGHLVREIDALDGIMGRAADAAGIQFRLLNRKKGPAVRGPRAQIDRELYQEFMTAAVSNTENLTFIAGEVTALRLQNGTVEGVKLADSTEISAQNVVLTSGTFLNGVIHIGFEKSSGGRMGDKPSIELAEQLYDLNLPMGRLKTGTPPRLDGMTINWSELAEQPGDNDPSFFSEFTKTTQAEQVSCWITHTNTKTHEIIEKNLKKSAMYGGQVEGVGPRYCPSIEDKIVRFADKESHQIFLEPEGLNTSTIYPNGISTSLPESVQVEYVRSIAGLENVEIQQPGYAIEYDYVDPRSLLPSLQLKSIEGLYLAGQINGTTGYEEAAGQGLVAGLNAARSAKGLDSIGFSRSTSYIGVMIDDLITRGVAEPYRMFTSRAEFRLSLRADNADQRLTEFGRNVGLVHDTRWSAFQSKMDDIAKARALLKSETFTARELFETGVEINPDSKSRDGCNALTLSDVEFATLTALRPHLAEVDPQISQQIKNDALYEHYVERQRKDIEAYQKEEEISLDAELNYEAIGGLSKELQAKLTHHRPASLAQAARIDGMTPAALMIIRAYAKKERKVS